MTHWHSLYLYSDTTTQHTLEETFRVALDTEGYTLYDPFTPIPGISYPHVLRFFIAPALSGWSRILVEASSSENMDAVLRHLAEAYCCLEMQLSGKQAMVRVYADGTLQEDMITALRPYLRLAVDNDHLQQILGAESFNLPPLEDNTLNNIPLEDIPEDLRGMMSGIDSNHRSVGTIFNRLTKRFLGDNQAVADDFLQQNAAPDWNSQGGQYIRALVACLTIPENWRTPDFTSVRIAYSLYKRRERRPNGMKLPGDADAMAAVPDALAYIPVYGGKS